MSLTDLSENGLEWNAELRAALPLWDAWCPDDGRPAHALTVLEQYVIGRRSYTELVQAEDRLVDAGYMCAVAGGTSVRIPQEPRANRAWRVTWALLLLIQGVRWPGADTLHWGLAQYARAHLREILPIRPEAPL